MCDALKGWIFVLILIEKFVSIDEGVRTFQIVKLTASVFYWLKLLKHERR